MKQRWAAALAGGFALASLSEGAPGALLLRAAFYTLGLALAQFLAAGAVPAASRPLLTLWAASPVALPFVYLLCRLRHVDAWTPVGVVGGTLFVSAALTLRAARQGAAWTLASAWPVAPLRQALPQPEEKVPGWVAIGALAGILALALWLRWPLLHEGLPYSWVWDEIWTAHEAVRMWQHGEWVPHVNYYPGLAVYLQLLWVKLGGPWLVGGATVFSGMQTGTDPWVMHPSVLLLWARLLNTLLACAAVVAMYCAGARSYGRVAALFAAAWLAVDPCFLRYSTWTIVDFTTAAFATLWLLALVRHLQTPSRWSGRLLGVAAGLVIASKYNAAVVLMVSVAVTVPRRQGLRALLRAAAATIAWALAAFTLASPTFFFDLRGVASGLQYNLDMYSHGGHLGFERIDSHVLKAAHDVASLAAQSSLTPLLWILPLLVWVLWRIQARAAGWALAAAALYLLLMSRTVVCNDANLLVLVPLLIFVGGQAIAWRLRRGQAVAVWIFMVALLLLPLLRDLKARQSALASGDARHSVAVQAAALTGKHKVAVLIEGRFHPEDLALFGDRVQLFGAAIVGPAQLRRAGVDYALLCELKAFPMLNARFRDAPTLIVEGHGEPIDEHSPASDPRTWLVDLSKAP